MTWRQPVSLASWKHDEPGKELYEVAIRDDHTVLAACGRYAQGSGSRTVTWSEFAEGRMNRLVRESMGELVLQAVRNRLAELMSDSERDV